MAPHIGNLGALKLVLLWNMLGRFRGKVGDLNVDAPALVFPPGRRAREP